MSPGELSPINCRAINCRPMNCRRTLRQTGSSLFVCLLVLATSRKNIQRDLYKIFRGGWQWANEQVSKFWWLSWSPPGYRDYRIRDYWEIWKSG